ncbi:hypothetical protein D2184_05605 [Escherichia coli]|uniref:P-loop ATPase, Sll1717 family n=1 Tax=Escherichia coli TaxID=562 RepID=UPI000854191A|nr:hypothetical protein [Escherichia coli]EAC1961627.1 hypothetical protein [Escherichia coli]EFB1474476.1 hypothetical protein [Escherichia coli]EFH7165189.1 hypothetical protein [Escherichia coli]EJL7272636.1 hypothetical protein [Escherichia coli]MCV8971562.1 hypothetical protein [Escherichia coli]
MDFSELNIQRLFGQEAAESEEIDRLKEYYFKSKIYSKVIVDLPLRILVGHKGIGKSALFKVGMEDEKNNGRLTFIIKPDDIAGIGGKDDDFLSLITRWKVGINEIIANKIMTYFGLFDEDKSLINKALGAGVTLLDVLSETINIKDKIDLSRINSELKAKAIRNFLDTNKVSIYIDDLDRGWQGRLEDIQRISALLNAVRDISSENRGVYFRVNLRSDVYFLSRTSDESTDKTEGSVIWFDWSNHEIFALLIKRVATFNGHYGLSDKELLQKKQSDLMNYLTDIIEDRFTGSGKWSNAPMYKILMSLIRRRPRDLVKLLTLAARKAHDDESSIIKTKHLQAILDEYSQGRLQDTINEFISELPDVERLILGMKPSKRQLKASENYNYTTNSLLAKLKSIEQQGAFKGRNNKNISTKELAAFLYKIGFITARKVLPDGTIDRKYFEQNRYLSSKFADFGYDWEVHPAYRWALQPDNIYDLIDSVD